MKVIVDPTVGMYKQTLIERRQHLPWFIIKDLIIIITIAILYWVVSDDRADQLPGRIAWGLAAALVYSAVKGIWSVQALRSLIKKGRAVWVDQEVYDLYTELMKLQPHDNEVRAANFSFMRARHDQIDLPTSLRERLFSAAGSKE